MSETILKKLKFIVRLFKLYGIKFITKKGLTFSLGRDTIIWLWWWERHQGKRFYSVETEFEFNGMKELKNAWKAYDEYLNSFKGFK